MLALTDADFNRLHTYIKANYGIDLSKKKQLIVSRLSNTLASRGYRSFSEYVDEILTGRDKEMVTSMLNKLTTNYTYFLREEAHFQFLQNTVLPDLAKKHARDKTLSIWSAGCSSGEEPYTISMYLKEFLGLRQTAGIPGYWLRTSRSRFSIRPGIPSTGKKAWNAFPPPGSRNTLLRTRIIPIPLPRSLNRM